MISCSSAKMGFKLAIQLVVLQKEYMLVHQFPAGSCLKMLDCRMLWSLSYA